MFVTDIDGLTRALTANSKDIAMIKLACIVVAIVIAIVSGIFDRSIATTTFAVVSASILFCMSTRWIAISIQAIRRFVSPSTSTTRLSNVLTANTNWPDLFETSTNVAAVMFLLKASLEPWLTFLISIAFFAWSLFEKILLRSGYSLHSANDPLKPLHRYMFAADHRDLTIKGVLLKQLIVFGSLWISLIWCTIWKVLNDKDDRHLNALIASMFVALVIVSYFFIH